MLTETEAELLLLEEKALDTDGKEAVFIAVAEIAFESNKELMKVSFTGKKVQAKVAIFYKSIKLNHICTTLRKFVALGLLNCNSPPDKRKDIEYSLSKKGSEIIRENKERLLADKKRFVMYREARINMRTFQEEESRQERLLDT